MEEYRGINEMTLRDYIGVLFRHKAVIITTIGVMMSTIVIGVLLKTPVYQAQVKMLITGQKPTQADYYDDIGRGASRSSIQVMMTQKEIATSDPVIERAVSVLGLAKKPLDYEKRFCSKLKKVLVSYQVFNVNRQMARFTKEQKEAFAFRMGMEYVRGNTRVEAVRDTDLFTIKVYDYNPLAAAVMANVLSRSYAIFDLEQQLAEMQLKFGEKNPAAMELKAAIEKMTKSLNGAPLPSIEAIGPATVKIIEQAKVPFRPSGIPRPLTLTLGLFLSVFAGVLVAFCFEYLDQTLRSPGEAEAFLGVDCLGSLRAVPKNGDYQAFSEQLYLVIRDKGATALLFASAMPHEGVTPIIVKLGKYIAEHLHKKVLVVDGNLRHPSLHQAFDLPESKDLINIIEGKQTLERGVRVISPNLHILTSGVSALNPITVLESHMMQDLIREARSKYDLVLFDSAPLRVFKDAAIMAAFVDSVVMVVDVRRTRRHVVRNAMETLKAYNGKTIGFVLNNRSFGIPKMIYDRV